MLNLTYAFVGASVDVAMIIFILCMSQVCGLKVLVGPTIGSGRKHLGSDKQ